MLIKTNNFFINIKQNKNSIILKELFITKKKRLKHFEKFITSSKCQYKYSVKGLGFHDYFLLNYNIEAKFK